VLLHEGASALLDPHQAAQFELTHRAPDRMPVHGEARGQFRFRRQLLARPIEFVADVLRKRLANLPPYGDAGTPFDFPIRHLALPCCHQAFTNSVRLCLMPWRRCCVSEERPDPSRNVHVPVF
jgi:hypothetical protein